jgi:hypothetical protein
MMQKSSSKLTRRIDSPSRIDKVKWRRDAMQTIIFDTHAYVKKLKAVGFTEEQAEVQTETLAGLINDQLVTKPYFDVRMKELDVRFKELEVRIKELETTLRHEIKEMESRIIIKLGAMMATSIAVIAALVKLL